ncbi:MAG: glycosyltransferase, partial [Alphaproteobacteria bacterium]
MKSLCILIGSADISGGSLVIFEHALHLAENGVDVTIVPYFPLSDIKCDWHRGLARLRFATFEELAGRRFDIALATWWRTVYELPRIEASHYAYFVQSIESRFYSEDDAALRRLVEGTYGFGLPAITEAKWIRAYLDTHFGTKAALVPNGCAKAIFHPNGPVVAPRERGRLRVLVEGPLGVDFKNVARTLRLLRASAADEIWLLTLTPLRRYPGVARVFSQVPVAKTPDIYRSCDVLVKLSTVEGVFGPPLEMFHCGGTAIVWDVTGHDEYIVNGQNAIVIETGDEAGVIAAVERLRSDRAMLRRLQANALDTARMWPDWPRSSALFLRALEAIYERPAEITREQLQALAREH